MKRNTGGDIKEDVEDPNEGDFSILSTPVMMNFWWMGLCDEGGKMKL